jgi:hypothetical protein
MLYLHGVHGVEDAHGGVGGATIDGGKQQRIGGAGRDDLAGSCQHLQTGIYGVSATDMTAKTVVRPANRHKLLLSTAVCMRILQFERRLPAGRGQAALQQRRSAAPLLPPQRQRQSPAWTEHQASGHHNSSKHPPLPANSDHISNGL